MFPVNNVMDCPNIAAESNDKTYILLFLGIIFKSFRVEPCDNPEQLSACKNWSYRFSGKQCQI